MATNEMTIGTARLAGRDAGNRHMRRAGRSEWNADDWNAAAAELDRICEIFGLNDPWHGAGF